MKQVAPKLGRSPGQRWGWMASQVDPDVVVLTEAKVPQGGPPQGWEAIWLPDGVGKRRRWGTVIAGRGVGLLEVTEVSKTFRTVPLRFEWPATVHVADVMVEGERWGTGVRGGVRDFPDAWEISDHAPVLADFG